MLLSWFGRKKIKKFHEAGTTVFVFPGTRLHRNTGRISAHTNRFRQRGFLVITTEENSRKYPLDFYPVDAEAMEAYDLEIRD